MNKDLGNLSTTEIGDDREQYVIRLLKKKGYTVARTPQSRTPVDVVGSKRHRYFWHLILVQVKTFIETPHSLPTEERDRIRLFGQSVKHTYLKSELFKDQSNRPTIFSVGLARVKNDRPQRDRCDLFSAELVKWYSSKLPKQKASRIKELASAVHKLR